jgi:hypothetical protein
MSGNTLDDLNSILFDTLRDLRAKKITLEESEAVNRTAQTIINSAKVEVEFVKATEGRRGTTGLIDAGRKPLEQLPSGPETRKWKAG